MGEVVGCSPLALRQRSTSVARQRSTTANVPSAGRCGNTLEWRPRTWKADCPDACIQAVNLTTGTPQG
jgi:hypothetical protein